MLDVLIIGAGLAGLTAARSLQRSGREVRVLEARDRSGGRAWSPAVRGHPLDLGPTWIWDSEPSIHGLLNELGVPTFLHADDGLDVYESSELQRGRFPRSTIPSRRIEGGVQQLTSALAQQVDAVSFEAAVRGLEPVDGGVRVVSEAGTYTARHVLAALPPSLFSHMIAPHDPDRARIFARCPVWMGDITKVVAVFERRFWLERGWSGRAASSRGPMVEVHDMSGRDGAPACLFGFVPESEGLHDLQGRVRAQLIRLFGVEATPEHVQIKPWWSDPNTTVPGHVSDERIFGHSVLRESILGGRVTSISCETSGVSPGHLDGAVERALLACSRLVGNHIIV